MLKRVPPGPHDATPSYHDHYGLQISYPEVQECTTPVTRAAEAAEEPLALEDPAAVPPLEMSLEQAVEMAVQRSPVLRQIGGAIVTNPDFTRTVYDPAITAASTTQGTEAALAAFDAEYTQQLFWFNDDRPNNVARGGFTAAFTPVALVGTNATFSSELAKQTATGARFALRHVVNYNRNNQPFRAFSSAFEGWVEAEWRQPLMQGAGTTYNRIAGPVNAPGRFNIPGQFNGVLIARINEDVSLADFEAAVIQLTSDVEQAYWDLVTAYRILDANVKGREAAQQTFRNEQARVEVGASRIDQLAQARSQFYQFQAQVESSLGGANGLYALEQRLRYLVGLPASDGYLIRPTTPMTDVRVVYDWESALAQALQRRVEIRRQRFGVKRRELELVAARLDRRPRLDFVAQYRWRGLGDNLIGDGDADRLDNLYGVITGGDFQEGRAGIELNFPVGLRLASLAVQQTRLNLQRERAVLAETELGVSHDLSDAARQIALTYQLVETNYNRYQADLQQVEVLQVRWNEGEGEINFLLQAQRQVVVSESEFYRALANYNLAIRDFHLEKGSLLAYNQIQLAEGPWAPGAHADAQTMGRFLEPRFHPEAVAVPPPITRGPYDPAAIQNTSPALIEPGSPIPDATAPMTRDPIMIEPVPPGEPNLVQAGPGGVVEEAPVLLE